MLKEFVFVVQVNGEDFTLRFWDYSREAALEEFNRCSEEGTLFNHL